jgi:ribosomal protein S18 acetylase RimI-like enzyme
VIVRPARAEDARRIAEIHVETWRATYPGVMPQQLLDDLSVDERERNWTSWLAHPETDVFVAEHDNEVVGFVNAGRSWGVPGAGEVYAIYVVPKAQGIGAGRALMDAAVAALEKRWDEAILWVASENPQARRFYERYGWVADGERIDDSFAGASVPETRYRLSSLKRR